MKVEPKRRRHVLAFEKFASQSKLVGKVTWPHSLFLNIWYWLTRKLNPFPKHSVATLQINQFCTTIKNYIVPKICICMLFMFCLMQFHEMFIKWFRGGSHPIGVGINLLGTWSLNISASLHKRVGFCKCLLVDLLLFLYL